MKKTILIATLVLLGTLGFNVNAQAAECSDVIWSAEFLETNPNIGNACQEVVERGGTQAVKLQARIVRQQANTTYVQWMMADGTWSDVERRYPGRNTWAELSGESVRIIEVAPRQEVNVYVPMATNWSLPAPAPAAAPAPEPAPAPAPAPAPEPEPAPVVLPTTATQVSMLALLGGLFVLLGGAVGIARTRL